MAAVRRLPGQTRAGPHGSKDYILIAILIIAFSIRLYQVLSTTYLWDEEREWIPLAESISFQPQSLNLPIRGDFHGALPTYLIELGGMLLGKDMLGFRFSSIVAGLLTVYFAYRLGLEWAGPSAARWTAVLLTFNEYHIGVSALAVEKTFFIFLVMCSLYAFSGFLSTQRARHLYIAFACVGLAFLCNEIAVLVLAVFGLVLLVIPECRAWLKRKDPYLAGLIFAAVILPDLALNLTTSVPDQVTYSDHLSRFGGIGFTAHYFNFFIRDIIRVIDSFLGRTLWDGGGSYPTMNSVFGLIFLAGVIVCTLGRRWSDPIFKLLLISFWMILGFFVLIRPGQSKPNLVPLVWFWVDLTLLPASLILGRLVASLRSNLRVVAWVAIIVAVGISVTEVVNRHLGMRSLEVGFEPEYIMPPNGQIVPIRAEFNFCKLCDPEPKVDVASIVLQEETGSHEIPTTLSGPKCAKQFAVACTFLLPASLDPGMQVGDHEITFRVADRGGNVMLVSDVVPVISDISRHRFRSKFWVHR